MIIASAQQCYHHCLIENGSHCLRIIYHGVSYDRHNVVNVLPVKIHEIFACCYRHFFSVI